MLGLAFVPLGADGLSIPAIRFQLNMYTGPGYVGAMLGVINLLFIIFFFRECKLVDRETKKRMREEAAKKKKEEKLRKKRARESHLLGFAIDTVQKHYDRFAAASAVIIFFVILSGFSVFET